MAEIVADTAAPAVALDGWELSLSRPGAWTHPDQAGPDWIPAAGPVPAAEALEAAGRWRRDRPGPLHDQDIWYRARLAPSGPCRLRFGGLATIAEAWLDGEPILQSDSMYLAHEIAIAAGGPRRLHLAFRSLSAELARRTGKRARWRTAMIPDQKLRLVRTTLLGHMPGWCPPVDAVGPWRPIEVLPADRVAADLRTSLDGEIGRVSIRLTAEAEGGGTGGRRDGGTRQGEPESAVLSCAGREARLERDADGMLAGGLDLPGIAPWWPHTHGEPVLHPVEVRLGDRVLNLGRVGFRRITLDRGEDGRGFRLLVNDAPLFCRGAVWMPPDPVRLSSRREDLAPSLERVREAGLNMLRVSGATTYQPRAFHDLCDELGILVWQDLMFANFDYPAADAAFADLAQREVEQLLQRLQASPSLAILCGGSEVAQQSAMMGLAPAGWSNRILDASVPELIRALRPDTIFVPSSPFGGDLPFQADAGCTHYYGVGAYRRPPEDARRAGVRFASECLAFANVPDAATLRATLPVAAVHHPVWKEGVPRDLGASWDFEDVRDHYAASLYGIDPPRLRSEDPDRYLAISRVVVADLMEATIGEWRRPGSATGGALVWTWQDLRPGAGWGVLDVLGRPKSAWYGLARASRPVAVSITDEGVNGLAVHALNDGSAPVSATLEFACLRHGRLPVAAAEIGIEIPARGGLTLGAARLLGRFFDTNYAYRFGRADHDVCHVALRGRDGAVLDRASWWLPGKRIERQALGLSIVPVHDETGWSLRLTTDRMAAAITIDDDAYVPTENYFDLAPGEPRTVRLAPILSEVLPPPEGRVEALNGVESVRYVARR